jgi:uncharacterized DUF497 family protein
MDFEWDRAKSERNKSERGLPFELAALLFDGPAIDCADARRHYDETRIRTIGVVGKLTLHCVYTPRGEIRRIISLRYANRKKRDAYRATHPG